MQPMASFFVGESGTELLFRLIRTAIVGAEHGGVVLGTHAGTSGLAERGDEMGRCYRPVLCGSVPHDDATRDRNCG